MARKRFRRRFGGITRLFDEDDWQISPPFFARILANILRQSRNHSVLFKPALRTVAMLVAEQVAPQIEAVFARLSERDDTPSRSEAPANAVLDPDLAELIGNLAEAEATAIRLSLTQVRRHLPQVLAALDDIAAQEDEPHSRFSFRIIRRNVALLAEALGLDRIERAILEFAIHADQETAVDGLFVRCVDALGGTTSALAAILGHERGAIAKRIGANSRLTRCGLVRISTNFNGDPSFDIGTRLQTALLQETEGVEELLTRFLGPAHEATLTLEDYPHLADAIEQIVRILSQAVEKKRTGVNILFHGPPGTGKTELAKLVAALAGHPLYDVGTTDEDGEEPTRSDRISAFQLVQSLLEGREKPGVCLFDEADDIFGASSFDILPFRLRSSKVFSNKLMESNPVPTIWIVNRSTHLPENILRRATFVLHVDTPPLHVRQRIVGKIAAERALDLPETEIARLVSRYPAPPAIFANAIDAVCLAGGNIALLDEALGEFCKVLGIRPNTAALPADARPFRADLSQAEVDLQALLERLERARDKPFSLCLHGAPGTGKSAFALELGRRLGMEIEKVRTSDLLSPFVGVTERNIRRVFDRAARLGIFLVIDEADSLLRARSGAFRSWEVTQVNEFLVAMEAHPLPFVCTTNLADTLDEASLRRFTFSVRFDPLPPEKAARCFRHYFDLDPPADMAMLEGLVPADFSLVRRKADLLGELGNPQALLRHLAAEIAKRQRKSERRGIGFRPQRQRESSMH